MFHKQTCCTISKAYAASLQVVFIDCKKYLNNLFTRDLIGLLVSQAVAQGLQAIPAHGRPVAGGSLAIPGPEQAGNGGPIVFEAASNTARPAGCVTQGSAMPAYCEPCPGKTTPCDEAVPFTRPGCHAGASPVQ